MNTLSKKQLVQRIKVTALGVTKKDLMGLSKPELMVLYNAQMISPVTKSRKKSYPSMPLY
jgi:hypothetical protein